jgi:hypothetical protein
MQINIIWPLAFEAGQDPLHLSRPSAGDQTSVKVGSYSTGKLTERAMKQ